MRDGDVFGATAFVNHQGVGIAHAKRAPHGNPLRVQTRFRTCAAFPAGLLLAQQMLKLVAPTRALKQAFVEPRAQARVVRMACASAKPKGCVAAGIDEVA